MQPIQIRGNIPTCCLSDPAFTNSPLWATANEPCMEWTTNGWQFICSDFALVEYRVWPIPMYPFNLLMVSLLKTCFTRPIPLWIWNSLFPSLVTIPVDSCPLKFFCLSFQRIFLVYLYSHTYVATLPIQFQLFEQFRS